MNDSNLQKMQLKRKFVALPLISFSKWPYFNPWKQNTDSKNSSYTKITASIIALSKLEQNLFNHLWQPQPAAVNGLPVLLRVHAKWTQNRT